MTAGHHGARKSDVTFCVSLQKFRLGVLFNFFFLYFEREKVSMSGRVAGRDSQAGATLSAQSPTLGLDPMNYEIVT